MRASLSRNDSPAHIRSISQALVNAGFSVSVFLYNLDRSSEFPQEERKSHAAPAAVECHERSEFYGAIGFNYCSGQVVMAVSHELIQTTAVHQLLLRVFNNSKC